MLCSWLLWCWCELVLVGFSLGCASSTHFNLSIPECRLPIWNWCLPLCERRWWTHEWWWGRGAQGREKRKEKEGQEEEEEKGHWCQILWFMFFVELKTCQLWLSFAVFTTTCQSRRNSLCDRLTGRQTDRHLSAEKLRTSHVFYICVLDSLLVNDEINSDNISYWHQPNNAPDWKNPQ